MDVDAFAGRKTFFVDMSPKERVYYVYTAVCEARTPVSSPRASPTKIRAAPQLGSMWTEMVGFVGLRAGDWTRALESDWEAHQARAAARLNVVVVAALERRPGGDRVFGGGEKLGRGGEMGRVA